MIEPLVSQEEFQRLDRIVEAIQNDFMRSHYGFSAIWEVLGNSVSTLKSNVYAINKAHTEYLNKKRYISLDLTTIMDLDINRRNSKR